MNVQIKKWKKALSKYWQMYLLLVPVIVYYIVFKYTPMLGAQIAFKDFSFRRGIWGSEWVGFEHFARFFSSSQAITIIWNTIYLGFLSLIFCFPVPIILALIVNEIRNKAIKKSLQTITYAPHFVSTIVVVGMMMSMCSTSTGIINQIFVKLGIFEEPLYLMGKAEFFRPMYIISGIWKDAGWNAIIFISALTAVDTTLYEAAEVDGANRWQQLLNITLPSIMPTIITMLILEVGKVLNIGFEKVYAMQTDLNLSVSEVISTYTYKQGLEHLEYDYATAIGLFNSIVSFIMLLTVNGISKKVSETSLF